MVLKTPLPHLTSPPSQLPIPLLLSAGTEDNLAFLKEAFSNPLPYLHNPLSHKVAASPRATIPATNPLPFPQTVLFFPRAASLKDYKDNNSKASNYRDNNSKHSKDNNSKDSKANNYRDNNSKDNKPALLLSHSLTPTLSSRSACSTNTVT